MSLTEISVRVAIVAVLALVALIVIGWRRAATDYPRRSSPSVAASAKVPPDSPRVSITDTAEHVGRTTTRKILDVVGLGSIAAFVGILVALVTSMTIAWMVTALLNRL